MQALASRMDSSQTKDTYAPSTPPPPPPTALPRPAPNPADAVPTGPAPPNPAIVAADRPVKTGPPTAPPKAAPVGYDKQFGQNTTRAT